MCFSLTLKQKKALIVETVVLVSKGRGGGGGMCSLFVCSIELEKQGYERATPGLVEVSHREQETVDQSQKV